MELTERVVAIHTALDTAGIPHAFGGALALGYCTEEPRGTRDIDVNIFASAVEFNVVVAALPFTPAVNARDRRQVAREGQVRLRWDGTPVDLFFTNHEFHGQVATRVRFVPFLGATIPVLSCTDLAVFKTFFARPRDWGDIAEMVVAGTLDKKALVAWVDELLGPESDESAQLREVLATRPRKGRL